MHNVHDIDNVLQKMKIVQNHAITKVEDCDLKKKKKTTINLYPMNSYEKKTKQMFKKFS